MIFEKLILIVALLFGISSFGQTDRIFIQCEIGNDLKSFYFEGPRLQEYLNSLDIDKIEQDYMCQFKMWLIENGNRTEFARACSFNDLKLEDYLDDLTEIDMTSYKVVGHERAVEVYDSLRNEKVKFMVQPSTLSPKKYELREMAYFVDTLDGRKFTNDEKDSIYYYEYYLPAYSELRDKYSEIDSADFLFARWMDNELILVINLEKTKLNLKPFKKQGIKFKERPKVKDRTYSFVIFVEKEE